MTNGVDDILNKVRIIKLLLLKIKTLFQERTLLFSPQKTFFVFPQPSYIDQLAGMQRDKAEKFYGKITDLTAMKKFGAKNLDKFSFWAWRGCGITCLLMILKSLKRVNKKMTIMDLINQALKIDGYIFKNDLGWRHQALVQLAQKYRLKAKIISLATIYDLAKAIKENKYVIASLISPSGGHLCLFFGFKTDKKGGIRSFFYHDPSSWAKPGANLSIKSEEMVKIFQNKALAIWE